MNNKTNLITLSIKDFLTPKMLKYALMPFILTMVVMYILFFIVAGIGVESVGQMQIQSTETSIQNGIPHTETVNTMLEGNAIIEYLMSFALTSWLASFLIYALGGFLVLYASIFIAIIIVGFLTPFVLKELQIRHYQDVQMIGYSNIIGALFSVIKWSLMMLLLFFLLIPFYFIPLVNIIAFNLPLYYFFHKMMIYDIDSTICSKEESKKIMYFNKTGIRLKTLTLYLISLIPFAIFFGAIFYVIYLGNTYFVELRKLRVNEAIVEA